MIQIVRIANPFEPTRREIEEICYTGDKVTAYVETEGRDVYIDGNLVEHPDETTPLDGSQIVVIPHVAGKGIMRVLGLVAMIALSVYSSNIAGGLWKGLGTAFRAGHVGALLASGAVMFLGGKIINAVFPQAVDNINWNDHETTQTYGWDLPTPTTTAGTVVGETYGECIPAPQLLEQHVETVNDEQYLNLLYCGGYGPVDSIDNIRIDYTDIGNFSGVQLETRLGTNDQKPISFFKNTPLDQSIGVELVQGQVVARTSDSTKASALDVTLEFPAGLYHVNDKGDYDNATAKFLLEYRRGQGDSWHNFKKDDTGYYYSVTAATNSALRRTFSVTGLEAGQYDVRVTAVNKPSSSRYQSMVSWSIMTSYIDGIYSRPNKVLVALRIKANNQLSGGVPSLNWRQTRKTVWVHNPETGYYEQRAADNPIWACYDILHGCRSLKNIKTGESEYIVAGYPASCLDAYWQQWKSAAAYADEEITNQDGEKEPRYRFDAYFDTAQKRWNAAQKAANVGHAVIIPHGRNIGIVVDRPGHITQIFGEGRTTVSSVKGSFSSTEDRARAIEVTYNDGQNDFKNTVMTVRSPNYNTDRSSDNTAQLTLFGVKRRSQAYREAITALATNERQLQFIELSTDIDAIVAEYGDIVGFNHAVSRIGIASGRIVSATTTTVKLDKTVQLDAAKKYEIYISLSNDSLIRRDVVAETTETDTLKLTTPFESAALPQRFDNYAFGEVDKAVKPFRIVNAERDGDLKVSLKLAEYDEAMYSDELDYSKYPVIDYSNTPSVAQITTLTASEESYTADKTSVSNVRVTWQLARQGIAPDSYIVRIKSRTSDYDEQVSTRMTTYVFRGVRQGDDYDITVYSIFDALTADSKTTSLRVHGTAYTDNNASNLIVMLVGKGFNLSWRGATGAAVAGYNVYRGKYGMTMQQCDKVSTAQTATSCYVPTQDAGQYVFYVESIDKDGSTFGETLSGIGSIAMPGKVTDASAYTIYRQYQDGATGYDIVVSFGLPATAAVADVAVYYKTNHIDMTKLTGALPEGVPADELGYYADWRYAGKGTSRVTIPAAQLGDTYRIKLVAEDVNGFTTPDEDATYIELTVEAKQTVPDTPTGFRKDFTLDKGFTFAWRDVTNSDVDYYELRYDQNPGAAYNLLARAQGTSITLESMPARKATIYLYAHNATKKYSYPASLSYDYPVLGAPGGLTIEKAILAVNISVPDIPAGADGVRLYIEHRPIDIGKNTHYTYSNQAGIYTVTACYYDIFGEGYQTAEYQAVIDPHIDPKYIEDESLGLSLMDKTIQDAIKDAQDALPNLNQKVSELKKTDDEIRGTVQDVQKNLSSQITQNADKITSVVTNLSDTQKASAAYSAIAQLVNAIQMRVTADNLKEMGQSGQLMSYINLTPTAVSILSELLHITADTLIDGNVITNGMIKAGAITADKLAASVIELTASQGIKGGGATLDVNGLTVRATDGSYVVHGGNGMEFHDGNGNTFAMVGAIVMGTVKDGQWVKFTKPWKTVPNVIVTPISLQTSISGYTSTNLYLDCRPQNVTVNGFQAICRTVLKAGSGGVVPVNKSANKSFHDFRRKAFRDLTSYTYDISEIKVPDKATKVTVNSSWALENIGDIVWRSDDEDDYYDYLFGDIFVDMRIDVNGSTVKTKRLGSSYGQKTEKPFYENKSGNDSEVITVNGGDTIKIYGIISVQTVKRGDFNPQYGDSYDDFGDGSASYTLTNYTFNTTADAPLASGNAFFLCTDQHNSPYTISDSL
ncbi:phage tail protein [uncultured Mitsuokella sp.]|uniref:TipJ family phage tail tip protein n=1 Tax=uncultured Mitsuokella sp. TaxID=453120 RepID=UPI002582F1AA|nr:phage tail protein [uncultured Mitsuokella sp.]